MILMIGEMCITRSFTLKLANSLCSNLRIVNSHDLLDSDLLQRLTKCISMANWFVLLENVDLLNTELIFKLFRMLSTQSTPFPRLFLSSTEDIKNQIPSTVAVEHLKQDPLGMELLEDHKTVFKFETPMSSVRSASIPTPTRLPTHQMTLGMTPSVPPSSPHAVLLEKIGVKIRNR